MRKNEALLKKHPDLTWRQIVFIARAFLNSKNNRLRQGYILDFTIPKLGRFKTHGNRKVKRMTDTMKRDKKRKRELARKKMFEKENLLF